MIFSFELAVVGALRCQPQNVIRYEQLGMRRNIVMIALLAVAAVVWLAMGNNISSSDSIDYQGQKVKLSKPYSDYDDYKDDPNNLAPGEARRVQQLVQAAPIAKQFSDRKEMVRAVFNLKFPGYGLGSYGEKPQPDGSVLALFGVEIPKSGNTRFLLFRGSAGAYTLIDDFVYADTMPIGSVAASGDKLVYSTGQGAKVVERSLSVK
jgi:hypothetical protein